MEKDNYSEKRKFRRLKFHTSGYIYDPKTKAKIACATFDLSDGGMRIITDRKLNGVDYEIMIEKNKIPGKIVYHEERNSTMMDTSAHYYGFQFQRVLSLPIKKKLMNSAKKVF